MSDEEPADNVLRFAPPQGEAEFVSDYISPQDQLQHFRERLRTVSLALRTAERDLSTAREAITKLTAFSSASHRALEAKLEAAERERDELRATAGWSYDAETNEFISPSGERTHGKSLAELKAAYKALSGKGGP